MNNKISLITAFFYLLSPILVIKSESSQETNTEIILASEISNEGKNTSQKKYQKKEPSKAKSKVNSTVHKYRYYILLFLVVLLIVFGGVLFTKRRNN